MHKYAYSKLPLSFQNYFIPMALPNRTKSFLTEKAKNDFMLQFPTHFLPKIWNDNKPDLKNNSSHSSFKDRLYSSFISNYPPAIKCKDKKCPDCFPPIIYLDR